ncbi:MAG: sugar kinase [Candidatus Nanopelagicales bacterium]
MTKPVERADPVRFVVVGDVMTDIVARVSGPIRRGSDTPAEITTHGGGAGANTAAWLAASGHGVTLLGKVGDDMLGRDAADELRALGVAPRMAVDPLHRTGTCVVLVSPDGERSMLPDGGANGALAPGDLPDDEFRRGRHLHLSGYTLLAEGSRLAGLAALDLARRRGMTTSVDPASAGPIADVGPARFLSWVEGTDVLLANELEATTLAGADDPIAAGRVLAEGFPHVVVKLGAAGAVWFGSGRGPVTAPPVALDIEDTTGAGDAFAAGFLPAWCDGSDPTLALAEGNRVASRAVSRVGARP